MPRKLGAKLLRELEVKNAKPTGKEYTLGDGEGLFLVVTPQGHKRWLYRYRLHGKAAKQWLGYYPDVSIAEARRARDAAKDVVRDGVDPRVAKKAERVARAAEAASTFEAVAREWHAAQLPRWSPDHGARVIDSLEQDAFPDLGSLPILQITAPIVLATIRKIEKRGAIETAQRVLQRVGSVFRFAVVTGRAESDPTHRLSETLTAKKVEHRPALPRNELPEFYRRLEAEPLMVTTKIALKLLALTFVRPGELRGARWEEFDIARAEWRIPAERMKMRSPHLVPLSKQALALLEALRPITGNSPLLFHATTSVNRPMSENTLGYAMGRMGYQGIATPHGFRALASTVLNEEGFDPDIIERQLAHAERNKVRAAYHRAEYLDDRRKLMQWWADFLDSSFIAATG